MHLRSLELQGYKTFASKTLFEFAGAITCIVGPNGSGKSNIGDSLRWVLGEQSYSLLRGKKTEDMIFSGSEQRPRAGMAAATVTFDNSDGWLPIDFSEVAVTRRAYRDGTNEYLINGQRVRLRDVAELLAQSGLAERTYTIIGQGVVDAALALKAEERRRLFEEAAGIGLHRSRREEALRRLDTTKRNLERVEDILAELGPRLRSLERQARRALEYEQVRADLRVLLRDWYGYHWHQAQAELTEARTAAHVQEKALEAARRDIADSDVRMAAMRSQLHAVRQRLNDWHRQIAGLHTRREQLSREHAVSDERQRALLDQQARLEAELARLEETLGLEQERLLIAQTEAARLEAEQAEATTQAVAARQALAARQGQRAAAERLLAEARQALSGLNARQGNLQARISERQAQTVRQEQGLLAARKAVESVEKDASAAQERLRRTEAEQQNAVEKRQQIRKLLEEARTRLQSVEDQKRQIQEQRAAKNAELARSQAQADVLEQAERSLAGYAAGAQTLLRMAADAKLHGARGALSTFLESSAEYEAALAAALGEYLDAIVVENSASADVALDALAGVSARAALLPLDAISRLSHRSLISSGTSEALEGELIGVASDLVTAPSDLRPVLELLLGRTLVVRDRAAARRLLPGYENEAGARLVTLAGEIFHTSGTLIGGQERKTTALGRQRQRRELATSLEHLAEEAQRLESALEKVDQEWRQANEQFAQLERQEREARSAEEKAASAHSRELATAEQSARQVSWQRDQAKRLHDELERGRGEIGKMESDLKALDGQVAEAREQVRNQTNSLNNLSLDEFQAQVVHWNTESAIAGRAATEAHRRLEERTTALQAAQRSLVAGQARLSDIAAMLLDQENARAVRRQEEAQVSQEIESLQGLIEPAEIELADAEQAQETLQESEAAARQSLSRNEHNHAQARILLAKRQETLETWRQRIEDDFGLVNFEYVDAVSGPTPLPLAGLVETLPRVKTLSPELEDKLRQQRAQLRRMGPVNPEAQTEYHEVKERFEFMTAQVSDLKHAEEDVRQVIAELDALMQKELRRTFDAVAIEFSAIFKRLFGGGSARLVLTDPEDMTITGIDIEARLPGRRMQGLSLLSGGERSLTASSLVFALLKVSPTPFCLLDEVDAMLDEANVGRFRELLRELAQHTQFIVVTHNRNTVQAADVIYGVTMGRDSASQVISLKLDEVEKVVAEAA